MKIPREFYDEYAKLLPLKIMLKDKIGHEFYGHVYVAENTPGVYVCIDAKKILRIYAYLEFAIVKLSYTSRGKFNMFVPDSTSYFDKPNERFDKLPFEYDGTLNPFWHDYVGNYGTLKCRYLTRGKMKEMLIKNTEANESDSEGAYESDSCPSEVVKETPEPESG